MRHIDPTDLFGTDSVIPTANPIDVYGPIAEEDPDMTEIFGEVIHSYTRAQALEDGVLVDVSEMATEAGISFPVAMTREVWEGIVVPHPKGRENGQSEEGRLWDVLWMLRFAIKSGAHGQTTMFYELIVVEKAAQRRRRQLKAVCGPSDDGSPCITIMLPEQD